MFGDNKIERISNICGIVLICAVIALSLNRLFFGAELSDEAYAVAENYMVANGALPFVNNWSQMPGYNLLLAPFMKLYLVFNEGTEGVVLFNRFLCFGLNIITAIVLFKLLRKYFAGRIKRFLCVLPYVGAISGICSFRGDNVALLLFAIGVLLIVRGITESASRQRQLFISGILVALGVMSYPTLLIQYGYFVVVFAILYSKSVIDRKDITAFLAGGVIAAMVVVSYLVLNSSFANLLKGIQCIITDVTYFRIKNPYYNKLVAYCVAMRKDIGLYLFSSVVISAGTIFVMKLCSGETKQEPNKAKGEGFFSDSSGILHRAFLVSFLLALVVDLGWYVYKIKFHTSSYIFYHVITISFFTVPFVWRFIKTNKQIANYMMLLIWLPNIIWVIITGIGTYCVMFRRNWLLMNAAYLVIPFAIWALQDWFGTEDNPGSEGKTQSSRCGVLAISELLPVVVVAAITLTNLFNAYSYMYREEPIWMLKTRIPSGPYKGLYTTKPRSEGLVKLEKIIRAHTGKDDYILAMDNDPFIYLMTEAKPCTPSSWDMALYSYGFNEPDVYYNYFSITKQEPTKIIYMNYGRDKIMSIDTPHYKFNEFINKKYFLIHEDRSLFRWKYDRKKDVRCELLIFDRK